MKGNYFYVIWVIGNKLYLSAFYFEIWNFNFWLMALLKLISRSLRCKGVPVLYIKFSVSCFEFLELKWSLHLFKMPNMAWYLDKVVNNEVIIQWRDTAVVSYKVFFFPFYKITSCFGSVVKVHNNAIMMVFVLYLRLLCLLTLYNYFAGLQGK